MHVCMYVYMYVCINTHTYIIGLYTAPSKRTQKQKPKPYVSKRLRKPKVNIDTKGMYACMFVCMFVCMYVLMNECMYERTCICRAI